MSKLHYEKWFRRGIFSFIALIFSLSIFADINYGLHMSQVYYFRDYKNILENVYNIEDLKSYPESNDITLNNLSSFLNDHNIRILELDTTFYNGNLYVSYGVMKDGKLYRFQLFNGKRIRLDLFINKVIDQSADVSFWLDIKNINMLNVKEICSWSKGLSNKLFIESKDINVLQYLKNSQCSKTIHWFDWGHRSFVNKITYLYKIYKLSPDFISQSYKKLALLNILFPYKDHAVWTNGISKSHFSKIDAKVVLGDKELF